jgi:hypothetical protein
MSKRLCVAAIAVLGLGTVPVAFADPVAIDPAGSGGTIQVGSLDWNVGNGLAVADNGQTLGSTGRTAGQTFTFYAHSNLANFDGVNGLPINGTGLNSAFEWTYVAGFRETIVSTNGVLYSFNTLGGAADPATNFFQIYYDPNRNSNQLTGQGFNDGTLILSGHILAGAGISNSNFGVNDPSGTKALDQFGGTNNYPTIFTITGQGGGNIDVAVDFADLNFFPNGLSILQQNFQTNQNLAFAQTDPSACFWNGSAFIGGAGGQGTGCANSIGAKNGVDGPNLQLQQDASSSFTVAAVPEPASLALVGFGMLGLAFFGRRRDRA